MKKLNKQIKINPEFTAFDWQLYSFINEPEKSKEVADNLNEALKKAVNKKGSTRGSVMLAMHQSTIKFAEYGAFGLPTKYFIMDILCEIYGPSF